MNWWSWLSEMKKRSKFNNKLKILSTGISNRGFFETEAHQLMMTEEWVGALLHQRKSMSHEWISKGSSTNVILPHTKWGVPNKARLKLLSQALVKLHLEYPTGFSNHSRSIKVNSLCKGCRDELLEWDRNDDIALIRLEKMRFGTYKYYAKDIPGREMICLH